MAEVTVYDESKWCLWNIRCVVLTEVSLLYRKDNARTQKVRQCS